MDNTYYDTAFLIQMNLYLGFTVGVKSLHLYLPAIPFSLGPSFSGTAKGSPSHQLRMNAVNKHSALHFYDLASLGFYL